MGAPSCMASSAKVLTFGGFKPCIASFRVPGVALRDVPTCFITCRKSFCVACVAGAVFLRQFQRMIFIFRCSTLDVSMFMLRGTRRTLGVSCCVFLRIALSGLRQVVTTCKRVAGVGHRESVILRGRGNIWCRSIVCGISFCMAGAVFRTLYTLHSSVCTDTPHSTLYTPHFTLYTLHSTLYTSHFTLNTLHPTLYTPHFTLYTPQLTIYTLHSTLYTPHSRVYTLHSKLYTLHSTLHILHSTLYTLHSTLHNPHFTLYTQHSPLNIPLSSRSTLCTSLPSTFHSVYSALVRQHGNRAQNCSNNLFHNSVLRDCVQVRGLHLVFMEMLAHLEEIIFLDFLWIPWRGWTRRTERALC